MKTATLFLKATPHYRVDAFKTGLDRLGYRVVTKADKQPEPGDIAVMWNRMRGQMCDVANKWEAAGARVLVAENGYIGSGRDGDKLFAMSVGHHLGRGDFHVGDKDRWKGMNIELHPWREAGDHVLLLPQRGIGEPGIAMPRGWDFDARKSLAKITDRKIGVRNHPGAARTEPYEALDGAHCAVTWASSAALKAICHGIPAIYGLSGWIGAGAAVHMPDVLRSSDIESALICDDEARLFMIERLAWAQWHLDEIQSGYAMDCLLNGVSE